jgi:hypothetical protein
VVFLSRRSITTPPASVRWVLTTRDLRFRMVVTTAYMGLRHTSHRKYTSVTVTLKIIVNCLMSITENAPSVDVRPLRRIRFMMKRKGIYSYYSYRNSRQLLSKESSLVPVRNNDRYTFDSQRRFFHHAYRSVRPGGTRRGATANNHVIRTNHY